MALPVISKKTLFELQEHLAGWTLGQIHGLFESADIPLSEDYEPKTSGQRRSLAAKYLKSVDPSKPEDARKLLKVFELVFLQLEEKAEAEAERDMVGQTGFYGQSDDTRKTIRRLARWLQRDGFEYEGGRVISTGHVTSFPHLMTITSTADLPYLLQQLERIEGAIDEDPWLAIGTAKEMVETTCKTILTDRGRPFDKDLDLMALFKETRKELRLVPDDIHDQAKASETIKRLLSNLATVVQGLVELRNPYGTGHGPHGRAKGLHTRHARLAAGAASTLALFLLETHREKQP